MSHIAFSLSIRRKARNIDRWSKSLTQIPRNFPPAISPSKSPRKGILNERRNFGCAMPDTDLTRGSRDHLVFQVFRFVRPKHGQVANGTEWRGTWNARIVPEIRFFRHGQLTISRRILDADRPRFRFVSFRFVSLAEIARERCIENST